MLTGLSSTGPRQSRWREHYCVLSASLIKPCHFAIAKRLVVGRKHDGRSIYDPQARWCECASINADE